MGSGLSLTVPLRVLRAHMPCSVHNAAATAPLVQFWTLHLILLHSMQLARSARVSGWVLERLAEFIATVLATVAPQAYANRQRPVVHVPGDPLPWLAQNGIQHDGTAPN